MTAPVVITVRKNGSLLVTGDFTLLDYHGNPVPRNPEKPNVALCRCGHSAKKPFCDGAHRLHGFVDPAEEAVEPVPGA
jgi:CDGSH-type Zn-finger protein